MNRYRLTITMDYAAVDDVAARTQLARLEDIAEETLNSAFFYGQASVDCAVKLQRLYDNAPPRLIDKRPLDSEKQP